MPNQPPSDRTRAKGGHPSPDFWILPHYAKRTQSRPGCLLFTIHCSLFTILRKRTQFPPANCPANADLCKTNPICRAPARPTTQIHETNPIYSHTLTLPHLKKSKRTQFPANLNKRNNLQQKPPRKSKKKPATIQPAAPINRPDGSPNPPPNNGPWHGQTRLSVV